MNNVHSNMRTESQKLVQATQFSAKGSSRRHKIGGKARPGDTKDSSRRHSRFRATCCNPSIFLESGSPYKKIYREILSRQKIQKERSRAVSWFFWFEGGLERPSPHPRIQPFHSQPDSTVHSRPDSTIHPQGSCSRPRFEELRTAMFSPTRWPDIPRRRRPRQFARMLYG